MSAKLYLEDGSAPVSGQLHGFPKSISGEIVFQTGMVGYTEALTDPSYCNQILVLTYPLIGNYGVPSDQVTDALGLPKHFESTKIWPAALIVDWLCPDGEESHGDSIKSLSKWLQEEGVPLLSGVDVRALTKKIREHGTMKANLVIDGEDEKREFVDIYSKNLVEEVSRKEPKIYGNGDLKILAVDCGLKFNQIRCLASRNTTVKVVPFNHPIEQEKDYDGLFLSNGPGDPEMCSELTSKLTKIISKSSCKPIFGICLGHQLLARSIGAKTEKMVYGNRGHNQPCIYTDSKQDERKRRCFITSQNHGFCVVGDSLPDDWIPLFVNANDGTNEGIVHKSKPFFSVQFHPEHHAGPTDMESLFDVFIDAVQKVKNRQSADVRDLIREKLYYPGEYIISKQRKVLILGSGGLTIGQAGEFDYSGAQAIKALKERGIRTVLINPNVATCQTSKGFADQTYFLPVTKEYVTDVIKKERPSGILCTFGGQTALNCAVDLFNDGVFEKYDVQVLGTPISAIEVTEDRKKFNEAMESIGEQVAPSKAATTVEECIAGAEVIGYPVLVRAAYALGGLGSGFATNKEELRVLAQTAFANSKQVLIDKSLKGFKEVEYEVVRDAYDNCITVCNMENVDPVGIHTGESVVVAPSQTLNDVEYNALRQTALKVIRHLGVVGECNIQYALHPTKLEYYIIEVNARLSRSSALASKATGYPLAYVAAQLALGDNLSILRNSVTQETTACFEPSLDYCVVKIPRWDLSKFARVNTSIGSSMKSVGEVMGIGRSFEEAFQKALRMVNDNYEGFTPFIQSIGTAKEMFTNATDKRMLAISKALFEGAWKLDQIHDFTKIDKFFLYRMQYIVDLYKKIKGFSGKTLLPRDLMLEAKQAGFSDAQIAKTMKLNEPSIRKIRKDYGIKPSVKQIDTVAAEWPAKTNYLYLTYNGTENDVESDMKNSVIVLGSGVYRIGSSVEFDACCVGCVKELTKMNYKTVMINYNPETVSTDYDICDRLYFEEISVETVGSIYEYEQPKGLILAFGGQGANNIATRLVNSKFDVPIKVFGTKPENIDGAENRFTFSRALDTLKIDQPRWKHAQNFDEVEEFCEKVGYPCLIRPSYVLSGAAMNVAHDKKELEGFLKEATIVAKEHPVVVSKFINDAKEIDVDAVAKNGQIVAMAVCEHVENAGIHSGDATLICPPSDLTEKTIDKIKEITSRIAEKLTVTGPFNMQLIAKDDNLYVIECNLRASRSFPFVSKTLDFDFIAAATRVMMDKEVKANEEVMYGKKQGDSRKFGVKVPQFSFSRLAGADVIQGVEMVSTGEVACYGENHLEAYLKGLIATGFVLPEKGNNIFLSFGDPSKKLMIKSVDTLVKLGFNMFASKGTAEYYRSQGINVTTVDWPFGEGESSSNISSQAQTVASYVQNKNFHLVINLPVKGSGAYRVGALLTPGYKTRRMVVDNGIPLITDIKCAKLFVEALRQLRSPPKPRLYPEVNSMFDAISSKQVKRFPGFIDIHVHMREPGGEHKETWLSGSKAAIAGGITMVLAMPNTSPALVDEESFRQVEQRAATSSLIDYALFVGATPDNIPVSAQLADKVAGMKMYLNDTFSALKIPNISDWKSHFETFPRNRPIVCHAEGLSLASVLFIANLTDRHVHICHISKEEDILLIKAAKDKGYNVTCEVCPHHLLFAAEDLDDGWKEVRPRLANRKDAEALWDNLDYIDCFATDHAPHTPAEKEKGTPGFPGVEYMLPLLLTKVKEKKLTMKQLIDRLYTNPRKIFNLPEQPNTYVEVATDEEWTIPKEGGQSKAKWTPFAGQKVFGKVRKVVIRGEEVYVDGVFVAQPGFGQNVRLLNVEEKQVVARESESDVFDVTEKQRKTSGDSVVAHELSPVRQQITPTLFEKNPLYQKDILCVEMFTKEIIHLILEEAARCQEAVESKNRKIADILRGYQMSTVFYENSTRTKCSFVAAMQRLGGGVVDMNVATSSVNKGESLADTIAMMDSYGDVVVLRHPEVGAAQKAAEIARKPVINAGDGTGQHPTQALLDLYTIRTELSTINNVTIALVGDLRNGRTVHSLAKILCCYKTITLHYVSPTAALGMPQEIKDFVSSHSNFVQKEFTNLAEGICNVDVIYMTRIQKERFTDAAEYESVKGKFILTSQLLNEACENKSEDLNVMLTPNKKYPVVMHPLPKLDEIAEEVDRDERAAYYRQAEFGVYVRMALLKLVLGI